MTLRKRGRTLVIGALTLAGLAGVVPPAAEARESDFQRARGIAVGSHRVPSHRYGIGWGGRHPHYRHGYGWRGYYGSPYHRYHRFGWGGYFGPYYDPYFGPYAYDRPGDVDMNAAALEGLGAVDLDVKPGKAEVWVDGKYVAEARDLDGYPSFLWLPEGVHRVVIYQSGYARFEEDVDVQRGIRKELKVRLAEGESEPPARTPEEDR